jgi:hypothetical protein
VLRQYLIQIGQQAVNVFNADGQAAMSALTPALVNSALLIWRWMVKAGWQASALKSHGRWSGWETGTHATTFVPERAGIKL